MSTNSGQDWKEPATELASETSPANIIRLAQELNEALKKEQAASRKDEAQANEPRT
jgi:hypothetical protein